MVDDTLIGMIGRRRVRKRGASPRSTAPADSEDRFIQVLGMVGPSHYLVQALDQPHAAIAEITGLMKYAWFETREDAQRGTSTEVGDEDA